jgi:hypothetical protein
MSLLNGGTGKKTAHMTDLEYITEIFIPSITPQEWYVVSLLPFIRTVTELVVVVCEIRQAPKWPLPPDHPLNPASRYEAASC